MKDLKDIFTAVVAAITFSGAAEAAPPQTAPTRPAVTQRDQASSNNSLSFTDVFQVINEASLNGKPAPREYISSTLDNIHAYFAQPKYAIGNHSNPTYSEQDAQTVRDACKVLDVLAGDPDLPNNLSQRALKELVHIKDETNGLVPLVGGGGFSEVEDSITRLKSNDLRYELRGKTYTDPMLEKARQALLNHDSGTGYNSAAISGPLEQLAHYTEANPKNPDIARESRKMVELMQFERDYAEKRDSLQKKSLYLNVDEFGQRIDKVIAAQKQQGIVPQSPGLNAK